MFEPIIEWIKANLSRIESLAVIGGIFLVFIQIRQQTKIARADHDRQKKQSTVEFFNAIATEGKPYLDAIPDIPLDREAVLSDKALHTNVKEYLARMERLSLGIATEVYDFKVLSLLAGRRLISHYKRFQIYIEEMRIHRGHPMLYMEFELLAKKLEKYKQKHPAKTVDKSTRVMPL